MKIKSLIGLVALFALIFSACDDDMNNVGGNIQPDDDNINVEVDTFYVDAKTISLKDSVYARTIYGLLGKYDDDMFGSVQSDYLCEFYCPDGTKFHKQFDHIDSTQLIISTYSHIGNPFTPMGLSVYELNNPLEKNPYTNINPSKYSDMSKILARDAYTMASTRFTIVDSDTLRTIIANLGVKFGERFLPKNGKNPLETLATFKKEFPGAYITTSFGSGSLTEVAATNIAIHYTTKNDTVTSANVDTTIYTQRSIFFRVTPEVIQLNRVQNNIPGNLLLQGTGATYIKSPAGVATELKLPMMDIFNKIKEGGKNKTVNLARFKVLGFTELEPTTKFGFMRPQSLLLINKDSINSFFTNKQTPNYKTSYLATRSAGSNTYDFGNIANLINEYNKTANLTEDPTFVLLPVDVQYTYDSYGSVSGISTTYNSMRPSSAILRSSKENMRLELIFSKY